MAEHLTIVARVLPVAAQEDRLEAAMKDLVAATRAEPGCLQYDLHRTTDGPCIFLFYETWETKPLWDDHMSGAALQAFNQRVQGMIESAEILQMVRVA